MAAVLRGGAGQYGQRGGGIGNRPRDAPITETLSESGDGYSESAWRIKLPKS